MNILCYGDSNTWGTIPDGTCGHMDQNKSYSAILQQLLGSSDYKVICEGMPSRTTNIDDEKFPKGNRNGILFFPQCLVSHEPIDYVVLFLGTNDMKSKFNRSVQETVGVIEKEYIQFTKQSLSQELSKTPQFIVVCPSIIDDTKFEGFEGAFHKSLTFNTIYGEMAKRNGCLYVSNECLTCGDDGIHLTAESHQKLAQEIFNVIKEDQK